MLKSLFLAITLLAQSAIAPGRHTVATTTPGVCAVPSQMTEDWPVFGPNVSCDGIGPGSCPTSGAFKIDTVPNTLSSNDAIQIANGARSIWTPSAFNSLAGANFNGVSSRLSYSTDETMYTSGVVLVVYAHQVPTSGSDAIFGGTGGAALELRLSSNQLQLLADNVAFIGGGTTTYVTGTWHTFAAVWNDSTGAWALYDCHGGTCTVDGSGTTATHLSSPNNELGASDGSGEYGQGTTLDWQVANGSTSIAGIAAYSSCKFGI
jgi:hypothetical protein